MRLQKLYEAIQRLLILTGIRARQLVPAAFGGIPVIQLRDMARGLVESKQLMHVQLGDAQDRHLAHSAMYYSARGRSKHRCRVGEASRSQRCVLPLMILRPKPELVSASIWHGQSIIRRRRDFRQCCPWDEIAHGVARESRAA